MYEFTSIHNRDRYRPSHPVRDRGGTRYGHRYHLSPRPDRSPGSYRGPTTRPKVLETFTYVYTDGTATFPNTKTVTVTGSRLPIVRDDLRPRSREIGPRRKDRVTSRTRDPIFCDTRPQDDPGPQHCEAVDPLTPLYSHSEHLTPLFPDTPESRLTLYHPRSQSFTTVRSRRTWNPLHTLGRV